MLRLLLSLALFFTSCSQVKKNKEIDESKFAPSTKKVLGEARDFIRQSKFKEANLKLAELNDDKIEEVEKSIKYNLKGVALFGMGDFEKSILNFEVAEKYAPVETVLYGQIHLNIASGYFKMNKYDEMVKHVKEIERKNLSDNEQKKYSQLSLTLGKYTQDHKMITEALLLMLKGVESRQALYGSEHYATFKDSFSKLSSSEKSDVFNDFKDEKSVGFVDLYVGEVEKLLKEGDRSKAESYLTVLSQTYAQDADYGKTISDFQSQFQFSSSLSSSNIGVVLPLSGEKSGFGQRALQTVQSGLKVLGAAEKLNLYSKDGKDNPQESARAVTELIQSHNVSFIIGGLFPESAKAEYLEAKKYGVLYLSLSSIHLPKDQKDDHLIEIQGSVESQVESLLSDEMIQKFGNKLGVIAPDNESGKSYLAEISRKSEQKGLKIASSAQFPKNTHDYRETAQLFLGLKYPRERIEELRILEEAYALEKNSIRRVQTLPPVIDFDWVFLATFPHEATQLIPTLGYYDANKIKVIGGPSWISQTMVKEQKNLGTLYFIGEDPKDLDQDLLKKFQTFYGKPASLVEIMTLDALKIGVETLKLTDSASSRSDFEAKLKAAGKIQGLSTPFVLNDGIWIKKMNSMVITRGEIQKLF